MFKPSLLWFSAFFVCCFVKEHLFEQLDFSTWILTGILTHYIISVFTDLVIEGINMYVFMYNLIPYSLLSFAKLYISQKFHLCSLNPTHVFFELVVSSQNHIYNVNCHDFIQVHPGIFSCFSVKTLSYFHRTAGCVEFGSFVISVIAIVISDILPQTLDFFQSILGQ